MNKNISIIFTIFLLFILNNVFAENYIQKNGDIIFQSLPKVDLVEAIEGVSESPYSHVGLVIQKNNLWFVRESIGMVQDTLLDEWKKRGREGKFSVYRFKTSYPHNIQKIIKESEKYIGLPYDFKYKWDKENIYCSELIFRAYQDATNNELGKFIKLGDMNWKPYKKIIEKYEGGPVPLERLMITPKGLSEAKEIEIFFSNYDNMN